MSSAPRSDGPDASAPVDPRRTGAAGRTVERPWLTVMLRELAVKVRNRSVLISTAVTLVLLVGGLVASSLLSASASGSSPEALASRRAVRVPSSASGTASSAPRGTSSTTRSTSTTGGTTAVGSTTTAAASLGVCYLLPGGLDGVHKVRTCSPPSFGLGVRA